MTNQQLFEIGVIANSLQTDKQKVEQIQELLNMPQGICETEEE
jgi:hypothetical protein